MPPDGIRPLSHASTNQKVFELALPHVSATARLLDVGAGEGYFSEMMGSHVEGAYGVEPAAVVAACDVHPEFFKYTRVPCTKIPATGVLPYADATFDVVCSLEVVEHVEDFYRFCREVLRVVRPGGIAILSTPNILNLNSRLRTLHSGFATLFDPLSLSATDVVHTSGHINPIHYYYLAFALRRAGARTVQLHFDRFKNSARLLFFLLWPLLLLGNCGFRQRLKRKRPAVFQENRQLLSDIRSIGLLTARSVVVVAVK